MHGCKVMDFDPRITSDGKGNGSGHGWSCNFHFGHGHDVIDEDAQNEKCCVQVLQLMIAKADTEIHDLEDELAILQCQLKWAESDKQKDPFEVCCATFKRKIDSLTSSIQRLKNENETSRHVMDEALEIQGPTERIYDIINALIQHNFSEPIEQARPELTISEESSSDAGKHATRDTKEDSDMSKVDDDVTRKASFDGHRCTSEEESGAVISKAEMSSTQQLASRGEGNSKLDVVQQGAEKNGSDTIVSGTSPSMVIKAEEDNSDTGICHDSIDSFPKLHDHEIAKRNSRFNLDVFKQASRSRIPRCPSNVETDMETKVGKLGAERRQVQGVRKETVSLLTPGLSELDNLRLKLVEEPEFLKDLKVADLKTIGKKNKLRGFTKLKKEKMIEELMKRLNP